MSTTQALAADQISQHAATPEARKPRPARKHRYVAVIGRITFDDEDSVYVFRNATVGEAHERFTKSICKDSGRSVPTEEEIDNGDAVLVNCTLVSTSPIRYA